MWPLVSTAKGLTGSMLYDVPITNDAYTGAVVNTTTVSAECGLLSNTSVGYFNQSEDLQQVYFVNVSGIGEVALPLKGICFSMFLSLYLACTLGPNLVSFIKLDSAQTGVESVSLF